MRNVLLALAIVFGSAFSASAQIVTANNDKDSITGYYNGGTQLVVQNNIKSGSSNPVYLRWTVTNATFGTGWDMNGTGICDNHDCRTGALVFQANGLGQRNTFMSYAYNSTPALFDVQFATTGTVPVGSSAVVQVGVYDTVGNTSRTLTFIAYAAPLGVKTTINSSDDVVIYPIPANDAVNVIYKENAGVRTIAVFNLIGKLMGPVYKPASNNSARINVADMPSGVYFLRLMDANGRVVATRRFTHQ